MHESPPYAPDPSWRLLCGSKEHREAHRQEGVLIPQFALVWFERGAASLRYGQERWQLQAGDAFKRMPGQPHDVFFEAGSITHYLTMPPPVLAFMDHCQVPCRDHLVLGLGRSRRIRDGFRRLAAWLERAHGAERCRCLAAMQDFCVELHQLALRGDPEQAFIEEACRLLQEEPELPVPQIAAACALPYSTFRRRFQEALGCSAVTWRIRRRIERAQHLLEESDLGITDIAEALGYGDRFRFSRQFHQITGLSPSAWRRRLG